MRTPIRLLAALALGGATAVLVSCGGSSGGLIPNSDATQLVQHLQDVADGVEAQRCADAQAAGQRVVDVIKSLPASVDARLKIRLAHGTQRLIDRIPQDCRAGPTTTKTTDTDTTTTPTDTTPTTATTPETNTDTVTIETDTTPTAPDTTSTDDGSGGLSFP